jgi:hypothetical protein
MLFLLGGQHGPLVRTILGAVMLAVGLLLLKGWLILAAIGAVLLVWGVLGLIGTLRSRQRENARGAGREP